MKVLWFSPTPSLYGQNTIHHNGGGWVASLQRILRETSDIELGVAFEHSDESFKFVEDGVSYFPININNRPVQKIRRKLGSVNECDALIAHAKQIIIDYDPDLIHVFGSESCFGLLSALTEIPVIIHMQGSLPAYANARFPPGYNKLDLIRASRGNPLRLYRLVSNDRAFMQRALREEGVLGNCQHFMGRTEWDRAITSVYNPKATYDYCAEALRSEFIEETRPWNPRKTPEIRLVSTLSTPLYKGVDLILKTAQVLRHKIGRKIHWQIFGISDAWLQEAKTQIRAKDCGVKFLGVAKASIIRDALLAADMYVHPSYIDNSPNSLCEAQVLGVPVVATDVGGISSLITHASTGYLVPANDPYMMAWRIIKLKDDCNLSERLSKASKALAVNRHAPTQIGSDLNAIYKKYRRQSK